MKAIMRWSALISLSLLSAATFGQQSPPGKDTQADSSSASQVAQVQKQDSKSQKKAQQKTRINAERDPDDYKASEEISEDLSVSYPVDI
ncbi:hypothetical protein [Microbulbifer sp. SAOS-129_SWC]|uniref:hypothetical protein n=1 Tax=Microbulbifer sp. SAOS-129_SWC TaxID=3145235 RepID=UPI003217CC45